VVIVDDGSTDATSEVARELALNYPQVRVVYRGNPEGREAAIRTGLEQSQGEVVLVRDEGWGTPLCGLHKLWRAILGHVVANPPARKTSAPRGLQHLAWSGHRRPGFRLLRREVVASDTAAAAIDSTPQRSTLPGPTRPNFLARRRKRST
jgi:hypothetical protein